MQLHRVMHPRWQFHDASTALLAEIATTVSSQRFLTALGLFQKVENVPEMFHPAVYGPQRDPDDTEDTRSSEEVEQVAAKRARAREVAADFLAEMTAAA
ncbi:hypothetical protein [Williamsia deligens]|uniref:Uncharacterized protein n=2 Tax=Williamsia deligens TaxID=321325 RepID=A0ABW3GE07_9NOCA|nr:hypothetical protein [Williamsia deligens]